MMARVCVDKGAIKLVLKGADVMCPGLTSAGGSMATPLPEGAPVAVYAEGKEHALALGVMALSTDEVRATVDDYERAARNARAFSRFCSILLIVFGL
jgi:predicted RNA-binding protein (TIGR00451 family)